MTEQVIGQFGAGAWSVEQFATPEVQAVADQVKAELESKHGRSFPMYKAERYRNQVVNGVNYKIKVMIAGCEIDCFQPLPVQGQVVPALCSSFNLEDSGDGLKAPSTPPMPGGWFGLSPATDDIQKIVDEFRPHIEKLRGKPFKVWEAEQYNHQVVAGMNYQIMVMTQELYVELFVDNQGIAKVKNSLISPD